MLESATGINDVASMRQAKEITQSLMESAGLKGETLTQEAIVQGYKEVGGEFDKLLPKNVKVKLKSEDQTALSKAVAQVATVEDVMAKAPTLAMIHTALQSGNIAAIPANRLHDAWKEVSKASGGNARAAGEIRDVLEGLIERAIPNKNIAAFKDLNRKYGEISDIDRIWRGGGSSGVGPASGYISPAKLVAEAGTGPRMGSKVDQAAEMVQQYGVRNYGEGGFSLNSPTSYLRFLGPVAEKFSKTNLRADPSRQIAARLLRGATQQAPISAALDNPYGE
jgi:hypothetical protein